MKPQSLTTIPEKIEEEEEEEEEENEPTQESQLQQEVINLDGEEGLHYENKYC